jgi:hypothetical protein
MFNVHISDFQVLGYWASQKSRFPTVHSLVRRILAIPASNTEVERLFSCSKLAVTDHRTCLGAEKLNKLMFLRKNLQSLKQITDKNQPIESNQENKPVNKNASEDHRLDGRIAGTTPKNPLVEIDCASSSEDEC